MRWLIAPPWADAMSRLAPYIFAALAAYWLGGDRSTAANEAAAIAAIAANDTHTKTEE